MTFWRWLMSQSLRDDPVGDLARDGARSPPSFKSPEGFREHLVQQAACPEAIEALEDAVREYRATGGRSSSVPGEMFVRNNDVRLVLYVEDDSLDLF